MKRQLTQILSLTGVIVKSKKQLENTLILEVESNSKTALCPRCQKISSRLHQNHYSLIKDIPWGEIEVYLRVNRRQFKCDNCLKPFSEELGFVKKRQKYTLRYTHFITEQVVNSDLNSVKEKLLEMKNASPQIEVMHQIKEEFTEIFDNSKNLGEGTLNLAEWLIKAKSFFPKTVRTIKNWFVEIVGYFEQRTTNAVVEGINNRLKVLKRCGFGFRNFDNFKNRALLFWHLADSLA